jgi:pSer/pThr/pTyr-binding forkhead associated (FHA) protein
MSELALTLVRLAFLGLLWVFVLFAVWVLRRQPKPPKISRKQKVRGNRLVVIDGPLVGTIVELAGAQITLGRAPDSTIIIDDDYASSRHARIYESEGSWVVEDLGSTNGTWIDRSRITTPTVLPVGAPLRIGRSTLQIQN